jgi:rare lipoprotein A
MFKKSKEVIELIKTTILAASLAATSPAFALPIQTGVATYYTNPYHPGLIAAHKTLPFGTRVKVTNLDNGRSLVVVIVDRGPFASRDRIIDVSTSAAAQLGFIRAGVAHVRLDRV